MAEALAVVAIVSSIVQLVDFTSKVVARLDEFCSDTSDVPKSLSHLKAELPVLVRTLQQIKEAVNSGLFPKECAAALLPAIQGCEGPIQEIYSILVKTLPKKSDGRAKKAIKSVASVWNDRNIESITNVLRGYVGTLTFYFAASSSTLQPLTDAKLVKIRQWLSAPDPSVNYQKALALRQANTGLWLLLSDLYKTWKAEALSVWLHGIPGCGKTVLSSTVVEDILQHTADDPGKVVAYFYFDFNDRQKQDPGLMVRSLTSQLSQQCIKISPGLDALFSSCGNGQQQPSLDGLLKVLQQLTEEFPCVYIIIDALDECSSRKELMGVVKKMSTWQSQGLHLLLTSRREGDIEATLGRVLKGENILCIQTEAVDHDIQSYVRQRLSNEESLKKWQADAAIRQRIESSLMKGAHGMFRWAACQLDILRECRNRRQLQQALADLPPDLDETYNRILGAIKKSDIPYAIRILRWLAFSSRPMLLAEVAEIAAIDTDRCPAFDRDEVLEEPFEVLSICSSLVTVAASDSVRHDLPYNVPEGYIVLLAHYSVKEYLVSERILQSKASIYGIDSTLCHQWIAKCCIHYLLQFDTSDALTKKNVNEFALAEYSATQWMNHLIISTSQDTKLVALIINLLDVKKAAFLTWIRLHNPDESWEGADFTRTLSTIASPLYYASQAGLVDVVEQLILGECVDVNDKGGEYGNALQAASLRGHEQVVKLLLDKGANPNAHGGYYGNALQAASLRGYEQIVNLLLKKGADVKAADSNGWTSLNLAASSGHLEVAKLLLEKGADVEAANSNGWTPLESAADSGHLEVAKLLLEKGADVKAADSNGWTSLNLAASSGHLEVAKLLLEKGADVEAASSSGWTPLNSAAGSGHLEVVKLLLEKGADVKAASSNGWTPLESAADSGRLEVVRLLLEKGADVEAANSDGWTPLGSAAGSGRLEVVRLLLEKGADVEAVSNGWTPLGSAVSGGRLEVVRLLLEKGADVEAVSSNGLTPLSLATSGGYLEVAKLLLAKGADVEAADSDEWTPLNSAAN